MRDGPLDWDYPRGLLVALAAVTVVALVIAGSTSTDAFGTYNPAWDGAADLRALAAEVGSEATVARDVAPYGEATPEETVAVVLAPREAYSAEEAATLRSFLERGGTLVVADDFGAQTTPLLAELGAQSRLNGTLLRDERHFYRSPALPVATNVTSHPLTGGVDALTLNYGTAVEPNGASVLVSTSEFAYADVNRNHQLDEGEALGGYPVVTIEAIGEGTLLVVGDPSAFLNVMLDRPGNRAFVSNVFAAHEAVILDYSHAGVFPPLALALLILRESAGLQVGVGFIGLAGIGAWASGRVRVPRPDRRRGGPEGPTPELTEAEVLAYLEREYPDWDEERVARVVGGIMSQRGQSPRDE